MEHGDYGELNSFLSRDTNRRRSTVDRFERRGIQLKVLVVCARGYLTEGRNIVPSDS